MGIASYYCRFWYELSPIGIFLFELVSQQSELDGTKEKNLGTEKVPIGYGLKD